MKNKLSEEIFLYFNNIENIIKVENCMTRVRISVKDTSLINMDSLKKINGVMGVVLQDQQFQIIVGPGICNEITTEINNHLQSLNFKPSNNSDNIKNEMKNKYNLSFSKYLKVISDIFIPIIPGFIACGLIVGITNILKNPDISGDFAVLYPNIIYLLGVFGNSIFSVMMIFIGITASTTFGLSIAVGAALSGILIHPDLTKIILFDEKLSPGRGGIISIILVIYFASLLEKFLKKYIKNSLDLILNPLIVVLVMGSFSLVVLQPIAGFISEYIAKITTASLNTGGFFIGSLLAGLFLPLVMTGLHQALIPIHAELIQSTGVTILLPILAMAGAGQVGASFAVLLKTKNHRLKKIIQTGLPVGLLGIGEPLIYGVTLPLGKPFITACIGGAIGGGIVCLFKVGSLSIGISGLPLALSVGNGMITHYLIGLLSAYVFGFILTYMVGFKDMQD